MFFDFAVISPQNGYKLLSATIVPRPIAWVVTQDRQGVLNAAPFSFFNAMSGDPPLVIFSISGRAPGDAKDTGQNIRETGQFVVNLVDQANAAAMNVTAIDFPAAVNELAEAGLTTTPSMKVAPPRIAESPVAFECERHMTLEVGGDRSLVIGRVVAAHVRDDCVLDAARCYIDTPKLALIGRMQSPGSYIRTTDRFDMPNIKPADWVRPG